MHLAEPSNGPMLTALNMMSSQNSMMSSRFVSWHPQNGRGFKIRRTGPLLLEGPACQNLTGPTHLKRTSRPVEIDKRKKTSFWNSIFWVCFWFLEKANKQNKTKQKITKQDKNKVNRMEMCNSPCCSSRVLGYGVRISLDGYGGARNSLCRT